MTPSEITGLHHVGLVVHDMAAALDAFRAFGFRIGPPAYPALPPEPGAAPEPIGAGNTHADFPRNFIELLAFAPEDRDALPAHAELTPLHLPTEHLAATRSAIQRTVAALASRLERFEGRARPRLRDERRRSDGEPPRSGRHRPHRGTRRAAADRHR